jgi:hypothetical protein
VGRLVLFIENYFKQACEHIRNILAVRETSKSMKKGKHLLMFHGKVFPELAEESLDLE